MDNIDQVEEAEQYLLLAGREKKATPVFVGGRVRLNAILSLMPKGIVVATTGEEKVRCVVIVDLTALELVEYVRKGEANIKKLIGEDVSN